MSKQGETARRIGDGPPRSSSDSRRPNGGSTNQQRIDNADDPRNTTRTNHDSSFAVGGGCSHYQNPFFSPSTTASTTTTSTIMTTTSNDVENFPMKLHRMLEEIEEASSLKTPKSHDREEDRSIRSTLSWLQPKKRVNAGSTASKNALSLTDGIIGSGSSGTNNVITYTPFKVFDQERFVKEVMPRHFQMTKYKSFLRQLNIWGFSRDRSKGPTHGAYFHIHFDRKDISRFNKIKRVKIKGLYKRDTKSAIASSPTRLLSPESPSSSSLPSSSLSLMAAAAMPSSWEAFTYSSRATIDAMLVQESESTTQLSSHYAPDCIDEESRARGKEIGLEIDQRESGTVFDMMAFADLKKRRHSQEEEDGGMLLTDIEKGIPAFSTFSRRTNNHDEEEANHKRQFRPTLRGMDGMYQDPHLIDNDGNAGGAGGGKSVHVGFRPASYPGISASSWPSFLRQTSNVPTATDDAEFQFDEGVQRAVSLPRPMSLPPFLFENTQDGIVQHHQKNRCLESISPLVGADSVIEDSSSIFGVPEEDLKYIMAGFSMGATLQQQRQRQETEETDVEAASQVTDWSPK